MSWLIPNDVPKYRYTKTRFLDREFGVEYTSFENKQIRDFAEARRKSEVEIAGYVSWLDQNHFLLLPAKTTSSVYFICQIEEGIEYPSHNQYITCKGTWKNVLHSKDSALAYKVLSIDDIQPANPDFGIIKPDINTNDFIDLLFERWTNVDEDTQSLIAQSLVSSPTSNERVGGFTLSFFNLAKERLANMFAADLRRFIPAEILKNKPLPVEVRELNLKHNLPSFGWSEITENFDNITENEYHTKLDRIPISKDEYSISLLSERSAPADFNSNVLGKSDYPIMFEEHAERKHRMYHTSPEVYKFLIAVHMCNPEIKPDLYKKSLEYSREELLRKIRTDEILNKLSGSNQLLDLGIRGRPLSILNLAVSYERGDLNNLISLDRVKDSTKLYLNNINHITDVWQDLIVDKITPLSSLSNDERRVLAFLIDKGPSTILDGINNFKMKYDEFSRIIVSLYNKHAIYQYDEERYASVM
ncbi:MAG: hypothetical protein ACREA3_02895 [Nitrosotalea sp.]